MRVAPSPIAQLNHAIAVSRVRGAQVAIPIVERLCKDEALVSCHEFDAILGHLWHELGDASRAAACFRAALEGSWSDPERSYLSALLESSARGCSGEPA